MNMQIKQNPESPLLIRVASTLKYYMRERYLIKRVCLQSKVSCRLFAIATGHLG
jgi:hypothetical protein